MKPGTWIVLTKTAKENRNGDVLKWTGRVLPIKPYSKKWIWVEWPQGMVMDKETEKLYFNRRIWMERVENVEEAK